MLKSEEIRNPFQKVYFPHSYINCNASRRNGIIRIIKLLYCLSDYLSFIYGIYNFEEFMDNLWDFRRLDESILPLSSKAPGKSCLLILDKVCYQITKQDNCENIQGCKNWQEPAWLITTRVFYLFFLQWFFLKNKLGRHNTLSL